jgi:hypothetical protein
MPLRCVRAVAQDGREIAKIPAAADGPLVAFACSARVSGAVVDRYQISTEQQLLQNLEQIAVVVGP